jgi:hypothetical protein
MWPEGAPQLSPEELASRLRDEMAPMVGRGKMAVPGPAPDGMTSWEAARGRGRNSELAARFSEDHVKPLIHDAESAAGSQLPVARRGTTSPHAKARVDHVYELIRADEQGPPPAVPLPWYHTHRAAIDSVGPLLDS